MINNRCKNSISSNETVFNDGKAIYQEALKKSGYHANLKWSNSDSPRFKKPRRQRSIIWFNPPFSESVSTKIGSEFFKILEKHFPSRHKYHKILNKNNVKLSYSCNPNIGSMIKSHNRKVLDTTEDNNTLPCNCRTSISVPWMANVAQRA